MTSYAPFQLLTRPSAANSNFPFHVRTAQIGAMPLDEIDAFPHNAYEVPEAAGATIDSRA